MAGPPASAVDTIAVPVGRLYPTDWWDRPAPSARKVGDGGADILYKMIGKALTAWTEVEDELGKLLQSMCLDPETLMVDPYLGIVFGAIESVPSKIKAFEAAAAICLFPHWGVPVVQKAVRRLLIPVTDASQRRNDIAHGKVVQVATDVVRLEGDGRGGWRKKAPKYKANELGFMLVAPDYATAKHRPGRPSHDEDDPLARFSSSYRLNAKDILIFQAKFHALAMELRKSHFLFSRADPTGEPILIHRLRQEHPKDFAPKRPR